jgi:hypothetical protein
MAVEGPRKPVGTIAMAKRPRTPSDPHRTDEADSPIRAFGDRAHQRLPPPGPLRRAAGGGVQGARQNPYIVLEGLNRPSASGGGSNRANGGQAEWRGRAMQRRQTAKRLTTYLRNLEPPNSGLRRRSDTLRTGWIEPNGGCTKSGLRLSRNSSVVTRPVLRSPRILSRLIRKARSWRPKVGDGLKR